METAERLRARRALLVARSAELRAVLMRESGAVESKLSWVQPIAAAVGQFRRHKIVTLLGLSELVLGRRGRVAAVAGSLLYAWIKRRRARRAEQATGSA